MWVAACDGKIVGMVGLLREESTTPGVARLQRMYVVPSFRGMGIVKKMLKELIAQAKRHRMVLATTNTQAPATQLYKKFGFKLVGVKKKIGDVKQQAFSQQL